jgi:hypothetical protein
MPVNVVKTPRQEHLWNKAKEQAAKEGKSKDWAYIMGIFKHMGGMGKTAGFIGNVLGRNVGKSKDAVNAFKEGMKNTKKTIDEINKNKGFFAKHIGDRQVRKAMKGDRSKLKELMKNVEKEQDKTFKARAIGAVGAGAAAYGGSKLMDNRNIGNNDEFKPQYLAHERAELIEKVAMSIVKEAAFADRLRSMWGSLRDTANASRLIEAKKDFNAVKRGVYDPTAGRTSGQLLELKQNIDRLERKNKKLSRLRDWFNPTDKTFRTEFTKARGKTSERFEDIKFRNQRYKKYNDIITENNKLLEAANKKFNEGYKSLQDRQDMEAQKVFGLYGGLAGATGYGIKKARDRKAADKKT